MENDSSIGRSRHSEFSDINLHSSTTGEPSIVPANEGSLSSVKSTLSSIGRTIIDKLTPAKSRSSEAPSVADTDKKTRETAKKQLKAEQRQVRKELRLQAKQKLLATQQEINEKKAALDALKIQQVQLRKDTKTTRQDFASANIRNFAHEKFNIGQSVQLTPDQVLTTLRFVSERRQLEGEIIKLENQAGKLKGQTSSVSAGLQQIGYHAERILRGLSRRGGMGRGGQIDMHALPTSPILPIRIVEDTIMALRSVSMTISSTSAKWYVRSLEKIAAGQLQEVNMQLKVWLLQRQTKRYRIDPHGLVAKLSDNEEIQTKLLQDPKLREAFTNKNADKILDDPLVRRILSEDPAELVSMQAEGLFPELFTQKTALEEAMSPVLEMKAQIAATTNRSLLATNLYKLGITLVDIVQTTVAVVQFVSMAEPTQILSVCIGALKIALIVPTFPLDVAIIRANLKDAKHSLSNLQLFKNSLND